MDVEYDKWFYRNTYKQRRGMDVRMKILVKVKYMQTICLYVLGLLNLYSFDKLKV